MIEVAVLKLGGKKYDILMCTDCPKAWRFKSPTPAFDISHCQQHARTHASSTLRSPRLVGQKPKVRRKKRQSAEESKKAA